MIDESWIALINWSKDNPFSTIERLEIVNGKPVLLIQKKQFTTQTVAFVKLKFNEVEKRFDKN